MPKATVVMPCYNSARFISASVSSILLQSFVDFELIIVDDGSTDDSALIIKRLAATDPRIVLVMHDRNYGASCSRNDGLRIAKGEFVGFCDADDLWVPSKLEHQVASLLNNESFDIAYCDSDIIDASGRPVGQLFSQRFPLPRVPSGYLFRELCGTNFINMQTVLIRRHALAENVYFDTNIRWVEDWWQWIRLSRKHLFLFDPTPLAQYRVHEQSSNVTQRRGIQLNRWKVSKRNLRTHPDMQGRIKALIWYQMGLGLSLLANPRLAFRFNLKATLYCLVFGAPPLRFLKLGRLLASDFARGYLTSGG